MSYGVIVPLIDSPRKDAQVHNMRGAFVAGLANGMDKELLFLQFGEDPVPLDYRDLVKSATSSKQIDDQLTAFAPAIMELVLADMAPIVAQPGSFLAQMSLGATAAENEISDLAYYYLETDEFRRVSRGEAQVVAGRKGSGKSALFFQLRDKVRPIRPNVVLDLRPEGFQLRKFKDVVLAYLEQGTKEHTITAFWEYLLLLEICHKILDNDRNFHMANGKLFQPYQDLLKSYKSDEYVSEGDFAERMLKLTERIIADFEGIVGSTPASTRLANDELTNLLYKHDVPTLRAKICAYLEHKREVWILFDNLDKGWPPRGLDDQDVLILRCLIEAISKIKRYLAKKDTVCHGVVFLRNDVYEMLVENTTDRGKTSRVIIDWTDQEFLREILRRRLVANDLPSDSEFLPIWQRICVSHVGTQESSSYLIDWCLMRPRSLLDIVYHCRSHAVNLNHQRIEAEDIIEGEKSYSNELVENICLEIRDIYPEVQPDVKDVLYQFIDVNVRLNHDEVVKLLEGYGISEELRPKLIELLLWWGFFGIVRDGEDIAYIYTVHYNMNHLRALVRKAPNGPVYYVNPAFWAGLGIRH